MQPTHLGRYQIVGVLGRGGMGVVYEGHDPQIERAVAIKTIAIDSLNEQERALFESRFRAEMRSSGRLQHQHIAALYDAGRDGGTAYIVMELVQGQDLKQRLAAGERFSVEQAVQITLQLLAALAFAHRHEVIHRDVKPANVMLRNDGVVKLCDFGVARLADSDATRTQGMVMGSLRYASPEQIMGRAIDVRTDVFSAGVLLFELLTGVLPFQGQSNVEILHRIATEEAPAPGAVKPGIPAEIDAAVQRALAKDPAQRFASADEFAVALGGSLVAPGTRPLTPWPDVTRTGATAGLFGDRLPAAPLAAPAALVAAPAAAAVVPKSGQGRRALLVGGAAAVLSLAGLAVWLKAPSAPVAQGKPPVLPTAVTAAAPAVVPTVIPTVVPAVVTAVVPAVVPAVLPALAPSAAASEPLASPTSATSTAPAPATPKPKPTLPATTKPIIPAGGPWQGQLVCGPRLITTTGSGTEPFTANLSIDISGQRITWLRKATGFSETLAGSFDERGRFSAQGQGSRPDRAENWLVQAQGDYVPKRQLIQARVQILRLTDRVVVRECTLTAQPGGGPGPALKSPTPALAPLPMLAPTPTPTPTPTLPAATAAAKPLATAVPKGLWSGRLSCGAALIEPTVAAEAAFNADVTVHVDGSRIVLERQRAHFSETAAGSFDAQGRFTAAGQGAYNDGRSQWLVRYRGEFLPGSQQIQGRAQIMRPQDKLVTRECTFRAARP